MAVDPNPGDSTPSGGFLLVCLATFLALGLLLLFRHEMWQDEWQAWLLASGSSSVGELFHNLRYEGHPGLWHLALFYLSRLSDNPVAMQLFHLGSAALTALIFLRYSPFTKPQKVLFIFGYFPFFEYAAISRNYSLGILLLFSCCALCTASKKHYLLLGPALFFLCQTNVYSLILALALGVTLAVDFFLREAPKGGRFQGNRQISIILVFLMAGAALSLAQIIPPADSGFATGWRLYPDWPETLRTMGTVWKSYVPIPLGERQFWGTNLISDAHLQFFLSLILIGFGLLCFLSRPGPLFLYIVGTLGLLAFTYTKYPGSLRHHGHLFMLLMACAWLAESYPAKSWASAGLNRWGSFGWQHRRVFLTGLLAAHLVAGAMAYGLDFCLPFSESREVADFIRSRHWQDRLVVGHADDAASAVGGYLKRRIYYPASRGYGTFIIWDQRRREVSPEEVVRRAGELARDHGQVLLLLNFDLKDPAPDLILIRRFQGAIVPVENYALYLVAGGQE